MNEIVLEVVVIANMRIKQKQRRKRFQARQRRRALDR